MNVMTMSEGMVDSGIIELSLDEIEMIGGGHNTRGVTRDPFRSRGGSGWVALGFYAFEVAAHYVRDTWGDEIHRAFFRRGNGRGTRGQMGRSSYAPGG